jgi:hypothetical protein
MGEGVVVRYATQNDIEGVIASNGRIFCHSPEDESSQGIMDWTRALIDGSHPTTCAENFTVAEDTISKKIVSACGYIPQRWSYGCEDLGEPVVEFNVGRPEIVQTLPEYRRRGLVRVQFDLLHQLAESQNAPVQVINGIHTYYRQFGYEYALEQYPFRRGLINQVPELPDSESEPYTIREATADDSDLFAHLYTNAAHRTTVACLRDADSFRMHLSKGKSSYAQRGAVISTLDGKDIGAVLFTGDAHIRVNMCELEGDACWLSVYPTMMRWLKDNSENPLSHEYILQKDHPLFGVAGHLLDAVRHEAHPAWYIRVPDVVAFLNLIAPVLEQRLDTSAARRYSGNLDVSFYRDGFRLAFENGRIVAEPFKPTVKDRGQAGFPDLTFLMLLFGYHSFDELHRTRPDCDAWIPEAGVLLNALFPKRPGYMFSIT